MPQNLLVGTRKSELAQLQTNMVVSTLKQLGYSAEPTFITTLGDTDKRPLNQISGDGFFTKAIEQKLLNQSIHMAVHSCKDLPSMVHRSIPWAAFHERESAQDILILKKNVPNKIGTSSPRRIAQMKRLYPESTIIEIRGNVQTRIEKVLKNEVDAVVLARAGVNRLNLWPWIEQQGLSWIELPLTAAPCQGILAVQAHFEFLPMLEKIANIPLTEIAYAEKSLLAFLGGGCHLALGAHIQKNEQFELGFFYHENKTLEFKLKSSRLGDLLRDCFLKICGNPRGPRVWLTQPIQHQLKVARLLTEHGRTPMSWPLLDVKTVWNPQELENLELKKFSGIVFGSQFGAQTFLNEFSSQLKNFPLPLYAVGPSTQSLIESYGFQAAVPNTATSKELVKLIPKSDKPLLIPGTLMTQLAESLQIQKHSFQILSLYESGPNTSSLRRDLPNFENGDKIVLTSPSAVNEFVVESMHKKLQVFAIGPTTSEALKKHGVEHKTAPQSGSWESLIPLL